MRFGLGDCGRFFLACIFSLSLTSAFAQNYVQFSADEWETDGKTGGTRARGNVEVEVGARRLKADAVDIKPKENRIEARGKVTLTEGLLSIEGDEAQIEMTESRGNFRNAVLRYGNGFYAEGRKLEAQGENRFKVTNGKISFCQDCPQSWSIFGTSIELEIEGYAEIHHALFQVKDQPVAYFPVFYFPIKTKRQSGLLLPELFFAQDLGTQISQPYFWAIDTDQDVTFDYRLMERGGHRVAADYRYLYSERSYVRTKSSYVRNLQVPNVDENRYGFGISQRLQISPKWVQRYQGEIASDTRYPSSFGSDFADGRMPTLTNRVSLAWQNPMLWAYVQGFYNANNFIRDPEKGEPSKGNINAEPELRASAPSFSLLGPLRMQTDFEHLRLRRRDNSVDANGWIRTGDRSSLRSRAYVSKSLADLLLSETSLEMRGDIYSFPAPGVETSAARARVSLEERLGAQLFRVYGLDLGELRAVKHTWEPMLTWGYSPNDAISGHTFFDQVSPKFDIYDPTSAQVADLGGSGDEARLRPHHLVSWGLVSRLIGRYEREGARIYEEIFSVSVSQDYDLRQELIKPLNIVTSGAYAGWKVLSEISLDLKNDAKANVRNELSLAATNIDFRIEQSIREDLESYSGSTRLKFLSPWSLAYGAAYDALGRTFTRQNYQVRYDSNASKCWFFSLDVDSKPNPDRPERDIVSYNPRVGLVVNEAGISL